MAGLHGVGMRRDVGYVVDVGSPAFVQALDDAVVAIMIEKAPAVEHLETLLAVKGVDMVQFGPADYSMSIGLAGQWDHPRVVEAERRMIKTALALGIAPRVEISRPEQAKPYLDQGVPRPSASARMTILAMVSGASRCARSCAADIERRHPEPIAERGRTTRSRYGLACSGTADLPRAERCRGRAAS